MTDASPSSRPVAIVANTSFYAGPDLARMLARRGFDLVVGDPGPDLAVELAELGAESWAVDGVADLADPTAAARLVDMAIDAYGRFDSVVFFSGQIVTGPFLESSIDDFARAATGCFEAVYRALRAFVPPLADRGAGQVLAITSAAGLRPTPNAPLYSSARAGANMLVRNVAAEVAPNGVQVNRGRHQLHGLPRVSGRHRRRRSRGPGPDRSQRADASARHHGGVRRVLRRVRRRLGAVPDRSGRRVRRRLVSDLSQPTLEAQGMTVAGRSALGVVVCATDASGTKVVRS